MSRSPLLELARERAAVRRYSPRTVEAYLRWAVKFVRYHGLRHPAQMGAEDVRDYLSHIVNVGRVAASTQNQALAALQFLYRDVLDALLPMIEMLTPAPRPQVLPNVLSREGVARVLTHMDGVPQLMAQLLYGSGLRLMECCSLRRKDVNIERREIVLRQTKGQRQRVTMIPDALADPLWKQMERARAALQRMAVRGGGYVELPGAFHLKSPNAGRRIGWMWVFPAARQYWHAESRQWRVHHVHPTRVATRCGRSRERCGHDAAGWVPHLSPLVCDTPVGVRLRHSDGAGAARTSGRKDHDVVHACPQSRRARCSEPIGQRAGSRCHVSVTLSGTWRDIAR